MSTAADTSYTAITDAGLANYFDVADDGTVTAKTGFDFVTCSGDALAQAGGGTTSTGIDVATGTPAAAATANGIEEYVEIAEDGSLKYKEGKMLYTVAADDANQYGAQVAATAIAEADLKNYFNENGAYNGGIYRKDDNGVLTEIGAEQISD